MKLLRTTALFLAAVCAATAQKEFLTADEVDKVREIQEPNQRLQLYVLFARQRMDQLKQAIAKEKKGRSLQVRELLEQYAQIIDAIDMVSDDALKRKVNIDLGAVAVSRAEKDFLAVLNKIEENKPHDFELYDVAFKDALENTKDSIDQASGRLSRASAGSDRQGGARQSGGAERHDRARAEGTQGGGQESHSRRGPECA